LPKEDERFEWNGKICDASQDWQDAGGDDFGWRRWIVEDEPAAEPAEPGNENQNFAAAQKKFREEIDRLTKLLMDLTTEKAKPVPTRRPWPKGPFSVERTDPWQEIIKGGWCLRDAYGNIVALETTKEVADILALALTEFPTAVAWIREHGTMQSGEQLDRYIARRDAFLARVDAAGFDMLVFYSGGGATAMSEQDENQNFAAKYRETQVEIDRLKRELAEAQAACAAWMKVTEPLALIFANPPEVATDSGEFEKSGPVRRKDVYAIQCLRTMPSPGQPLLDELDRLNKLVADLTKERDNLLAAIPEVRKGD
jgi:hypothetical protein